MQGHDWIPSNRATDHRHLKITKDLTVNLPGTLSEGVLQKALVESKARGRYGIQKRGLTWWRTAKEGPRVPALQQVTSDQSRPQQEGRQEEEEEEEEQEEEENQEFKNDKPDVWCGMF